MNSCGGKVTLMMVMGVVGVMVVMIMVNYMA